MNINDTRIKGTSVEGIQFFENELRDYIQKTADNIKKVESVQRSSSSFWNDEKHGEAQAQIERFLSLNNDLKSLRDLLQWIDERKKRFSEAMEILESAKRSL